MHKGIFHDLFVARQKGDGLQRGGRVVEGARLESVYTPKGYRGFESLPLCDFAESRPLNSTFFDEWCEFCGNENANLDFTKT